MTKGILIILILGFISCKETSKISQDIITQTVPTVPTVPTVQSLINPSGKTIKTRFILPNGFQRENYQQNSFQFYLQNFSLKPYQTKVHLYNGKLKYRQDVHESILEISVGKRDLQQCADATIRLRAEYLFKEHLFDQIHFKFTNGFDAMYSKWRKGERIRVNGNKVSWIKNASSGDSRKSFDKYLTMVFSYAGTLSLEKELKKITIEELQIGDIFIKGGSPGHAVIVVDMAKNKEGNKIFLLAQSYMPAQEIHIIKNFNNQNISPWYSTENLEILHTPEWDFSKYHLKRF